MSSVSPTGNSIQRLSWKEARSDVREVNADLASIIDKLDPGVDYPLYKVSYSYGDFIVERGVFHLPNPEGYLVPIHDPSIPNEVRQDLDYTNGGEPTGILIRNCIQESVVFDKKLLPLSVASPGSVCALWRKLDVEIPHHPVKIFSITAGANSIFMLPNIGNQLQHKALKSHYGVVSKAPKELIEHWDIFKTIAAHPNSNANWQVEIIFFSKNWLTQVSEAMQANAAHPWHELTFYFLRRVWRNSASERNQLYYIDHPLSCVQKNRNLKPNPYLVDTVRHLLLICLGTIAGFSAAQDESLAPIGAIQQAYLDSYKIDYVPIIMVPKHFSLLGTGENQPVYYSLQVPTTFIFAPKSRKLSNTVDDLEEIMHVMNTFIDEVRNENLGVEDTAIGYIAENVAFDYYHTKVGMHAGLRATDTIPSDDKAIQANLNHFSEKDFPHSGAFIRGCVRMLKVAV